MPTNLYGPGDNYHPENSHVIPALIRRFHEAKNKNTPSVTIWGSGKPRREFLYVEDMAEAAVFLMGLAKEEYDKSTSPRQSYLNVGYGHDITISDLATAIAQTINYKGRINFDISKPDGPPRKLLNSSRLNQLGWSARHNLLDGLRKTYNDFCMHYQKS
jgi:GDP-L-fucose synthase